MSFPRRNDISTDGRGEWRLLTVVKPYPEFWWPVELLEPEGQSKLLRCLLDECGVTFRRVRLITDLHAEVLDGSLVIGALVCVRRGA